MTAPGATSDAPTAAEPTIRRGTAFQRARAGLLEELIALLSHLPIGVVDGFCNAAGELWYRAAPARGAIARGNLAHVVATLAADGRSGPRVRAAAADPAALERLVRSAFRHAARTYVETLRGAAGTRDIRRRLLIETPESVDAAFAFAGPMVFATLHFGSLAAMLTVLEDRSQVPITGPMETLDDPELQRVIRRARERPNVRTVDLRDARRELRAALDRGEAVGLVADRDLTGGGLLTPLFGLPAPLPIGPALLALQAGAPLHVAAVRRVRGGFRGRIVTLAHPSADLSRRARVEALVAAEARAFEEFVARAPDQWTAVFYPIWEAVGPQPRAPRSTAPSGPEGPSSPLPEVPTR